ncbi:hypothetical protein E5S70_07165 [Ensifer adhaerens]|nr:hypothetical protein [Ensifer canadensis]
MSARIFSKSKPAPDDEERDLKQIFGLSEGMEPEVVIRLREDAEWLRKHGYSENSIAALAELKADLQMDKHPGWSSQAKKV